MTVPISLRRASATTVRIGSRCRGWAGRIHGRSPRSAAPFYAHWVVCGAEQIRSAHLGAAVSCAICSSASHATGTCCVPSEWVPSGLGVSLDQGYLQIAELTRGFFSNPRDNDGVPRDMFLTQVINTDDSRASGYHWFTVAVSLRLNHVEPEPMDLDERG
jgi:hypothetical protein